MRITFKTAQEYFNEFVKAQNLDSSYKLKSADVRLGALCWIGKESESGGIANITGCLSYKEMIAYMNGFEAAKQNKFN